MMYKGIRKFIAPEIMFGEKALKSVIQYVINFCASHVFLVTDKNLMSLGWPGKVTETFDEFGIRYTVYDKPTPNPKDHEVMEGVELYRKNGCDVIVAVGGGSVLDCAKGIGIVSQNNGNVLDYKGVDKIEVPLSPLICIPTTAGSSADVSQFAIITDTVQKVKIAIVSKTVVPDVALIDPLTTLTMDKELTVFTGMDALAHAFESYVSNAASSMTDLYSYESIKIIVEYLTKTAENLNTTGYRYQMMLASMYAGLAFSNASLGAVHAMAHSLGGVMDMPHGEANSQLLPYIVEMNYDYAESKYQKIAELFGCRKNHKELLINKLFELQTCLNVSPKIKTDYKLNSELIKTIIDNAMGDPCMVTNPFLPEHKDLESVCEKIF